MGGTELKSVVGDGGGEVKGQTRREEMRGQLLVRRAAFSWP